MNSQASATLLQRIDVALSLALRNDHERVPLRADSHSLDTRDLLIKGITERDLPISLGRSRHYSPHSGIALAVNSFLPWRRSSQELELADHSGFEAIQFDVRCPTGLRGTPPHLDVLALHDDHAVAVTVRSIEFLTRRRSSIAFSYDELLAETPGMKPWYAHLTEWREGEKAIYQHVDLAALVKYATALGHVFPDRSSTLLYLYWEPLDADAYDAYQRHRRELGLLTKAVSGARVEFASRSFEHLWQNWSERTSPGWLADHVARLRRRYTVALDSAGSHS